MPQTLTEGQHRGEFLVSEANGDRSRETVTVASGETLKPGHVLGQVTASGEYKKYNPSNADGSETAVAVCYDHVDASGGAVDAPIVARDAEVNRAELVWFSGATDAQKTTGVDELAAQSGIVAR
jgi:hypothetical protein